MATVKDSIPHIVRTSADQRQRDMFRATIGRIEQVNSKIRLLRLYLDNDQSPLRHLPGQYVDLHVPEVERVGGFTITSPPQTAIKLPAPTPSTTTPPSAATFDDPYIELAIQKALDNPPAAYLWQQPDQIMNAPVRFRIGGNFTFPPMTLSMPEFQQINNVVLIAGGVGINPIMSMVTAMDMLGAKRMGGLPSRLRILYTSRRGLDGKGKLEEILFEERLKAIAAKRASKQDNVDFGYTFFETFKDDVPANIEQDTTSMPLNMKTCRRRIKLEDLAEAVGSENQRQTTLVYVCGLPDMTDDFVQLLKAMPGLDEKRVLCEKWW
ncbi:hypothetical protein LTS08_001106 [Lithohypha guttulata]|nr:hypothetical protein LTS08_001106 [Lithohypha guttulata]